MGITIQAFRDAHARRHDTAKELKAAGKKVMNWNCIFVPEELLHAAGIVPLRLLGEHGEETPIGDAYVQTNVCTYLRSCLQEVFTGKLDYLDGFVSSNSCDHYRRFYDTWNYYRKPPFMHQVLIPHKTDDVAVGFYRESFRRLKSALEEHYSITIPDESVRQSIQLYNKTRSLLKELYSFRKVENPPIAGSEILDVVLAGLVLPKETYNDMLATLLEEFRTQGEAEMDGELPRVLVMGSEMDDSSYLKTIEDIGALIVADDLCIGSRYFWTSVENGNGDPLEDLARRYLTGVTCPRIFVEEKRLAQMDRMIDEFRVEAVIYIQLKFCDLNGCFFPIVKRHLKEAGLPVLFLDREYNPTGIGQMKTRVQAFLESLGF